MKTPLLKNSIDYAISYTLLMLNIGKVFEPVASKDKTNGKRLNR